MRHLRTLVIFRRSRGAKRSPSDPGRLFDLPNGWRLTPVGKSIATEDMVLNTVAAPDGLAVIAMQAGYNPHGLVVIDTKTEEAVQRIPLKSAWFGMAWSPDGKRLYVSGGNANGDKEGYTRNPTRAPIYVFDYANGRLSNAASGNLEETIDTSELFWSGVAHHPKKNILYAANRGTGFGTGNVVVFDTSNGKLLGRIPVDLIPYDLVPSEDGKIAVRLEPGEQVGQRDRHGGYEGGRKHPGGRQPEPDGAIRGRPAVRGLLERQHRGRGRHEDPLGDRENLDHASPARARGFHSQRARARSRQRTAVRRQRRQQRHRGGACRRTRQERSRWDSFPAAGIRRRWRFLPQAAEAVHRQQQRQRIVFEYPRAGEPSAAGTGRQRKHQEPAKRQRRDRRTSPICAPS